MTRIQWTQVAVGVTVGAVLAGGAVMLALPSRLSYLEGVVDVVRDGGPSQPSPAASRQSAGRPDAVLTVIAELQRTYVRASYGEMAGQNFSDQDLARFEADGVVTRIVDSLRHQPAFRSAVLDLQAADEALQRDILLRASRPLRRTWAEIGAITPDGQTEAGNRAERLIGAAVAALCRELLSLAPGK
jgi:hypothetical protein